MKRLFLMAILAMSMVSLFVAGCSDEKSVNWVPSLENIKHMPYRQVYVVRDVSGTTDFEITVTAQEKSMLEKISASNFSVEMLPLEDGSELPIDRKGAGVVVDGTVIEHTEHTHLNLGPLQKPSPVFIKVHALLDEEPPRFRVTLHDFPESELSMVVNAGHYKSLVLRRTGSGSSYARFYHHHGDWNLHVLYEGWFTRCTYAYDCYPGHSVPSHWTSRGDESIEFRADCYGRCP